MRVTRRNLRTSVIAAGVIAGLALPASAAFADAPADPGTGQEQVLPGKDDAKKDDVTKDETKKDENKRDENKRDESKKDESKKDESKKDEQKKDDTTAGKRVLVNTVQLADKASTAKIYKLGQNHHEADIFANGSKLDTLVANGQAAYGQHNGLHVALQPSGQIKSWVEGGKKDEKKDGKKEDKKKDEQKKDARTFVREYKNLGASGFDAKVYKTKTGYEADMIAKATDSNNKIVWDTLKQSGNKAAYGQHNGAHFVLNPDGTMKGWTEGGKKSDQKTEKKSDQKTEQGKVIPKGGVKAGAESTGEDGTALLAAGGGMAAAGAAGLGFVMLRRGRQNG